MMAALFVTTFWLHAATLTVTACVLMLRARKLERKSMEYFLLSNTNIFYSIAPRIPPGRVLRGEICGTCLPGDVLRGSPRVCACACVCTCVYVCKCLCMCLYAYMCLYVWMLGFVGLSDYRVAQAPTFVIQDAHSSSLFIMQTCIPLRRVSMVDDTGA